MTAVDPSTAPTPAARVELASIRASLLAWDTRADGPELAAYDAWATWVLAMLREKIGGPLRSVAAYRSHAEARHIVLELTLAVLRRTAAMGDEEHRAVWSQAEADEALVIAILVRTMRQSRPAVAKAGTR